MLIFIQFLSNASASPNVTNHDFVSNVFLNLFFDFSFFNAFDFDIFDDFVQMK